MYFDSLRGLLLGSLLAPLGLVVQASPTPLLPRQDNSTSSSNGTDAGTVWTPVGNESNGTEAIQMLVERRLPRFMHSMFEFTLSDSTSGSNNGNGSYDSFSISTSNSSRISIHASTTSGLSRGLLTYLRQVGGDIYWSGNTFTEEILTTGMATAGDVSMTGETWAEVRYLFNVVTYSYSMAWYDWTQWEYLLDWASLHGVNLPLAIGGQEFIWAEVYRDLGLPEDQVLSYFSGPAFESWMRMGNIHGSWGMNVTQDWLDKQWTLQKQIVSRMVALGMTPVLPAFNGFVPKGLQDLVGGPEFLKASQWSDFEYQYTNNSAIDPIWSTWQTMQQLFLEKQKSLYGGWTSHYYSIDLYNELTPSSLDLGYLKNNTQNVIKSLRDTDSDAVWVMQGWLFVSDTKSWNKTTIEALLSGSNPGEMLILDLTSEANPAWNFTDSYYGQNWVWNLLFNYGENDGFGGSLPHYATEVLRAKQNSSGLHGLGLTMEGINNNEIVFEFTLDLPWSTQVVETIPWVEEFIKRRYGLCVYPSGSSAVEGWKLLAGTVLNNTDSAVQGSVKSPFELVPATMGIGNRTGHHATKLTYQPDIVTQALDQLIDAADAAPGLESVEAFAYDLVDTARQALINAGLPLYVEMLAAWNTSSPDTNAITTLGSTISSLLTDINTLLGTNKNFLLASWISDARKWSDDPSTKDFYEARNQIMVWGPANQEPWGLDRYASKQWHGTLDFYAKNWEMYTQYLLSTSPADYNQTTWATQLSPSEEQWQTEIYGQQGESWVQTGQVVATVKAMRQKWASYL